VEPPAYPTCPICGHQGWADRLSAVDHHLSEQTFTLADCTSCGFRITQPPLGPAQLALFYSPRSYLSHDASGLSLLRVVYRISRSFALRLKGRLVSRFTPSGELLDVGCGSGAFLAYMASKGYRCAGVEPDPIARKAAQVHAKSTVLAELCEVAGRERFHAITLWHVLEHMQDLNASLRRLFELLKPGGHLFIAVPDRGSYDASHYGPYWAAWDVPRHRWHFRETDLRQLLIAHGFVPLSARRMWLDAFYIAVLSERYQGRPAWIAWMLGLFHGAASNFLAFARGTPASSMLLIAQKPDRASSP
jgi:SAM-dependent methyltransferase